MICASDIFCGFLFISFIRLCLQSFGYGFYSIYFMCSLSLFAPLKRNRFNRLNGAGRTAFNGTYMKSDFFFVGALQCVYIPSDWIKTIRPTGLCENINTERSDRKTNDIVVWQLEKKKRRRIGWSTSISSGLVDTFEKFSSLSKPFTIRFTLDVQRVVEKIAYVSTGLRRNDDRKKN